MAAKVVVGVNKDDLLARLRKSTRSLKVKGDQPTFEDLSARKIPEEKLREKDLVRLRLHAVREYKAYNCRQVLEMLLNRSTDSECYLKNNLLV